MQFDCGPLRFRTMDLAAGQRVPSHKHNFAHPTVVCSGVVRLDMPDGTFDLDGSNPDASQRVKLVPAGIEHTITALTKAQVMCIYPHRAEAGEIVPTNVGFEPGYF